MLNLCGSDVLLLGDIFRAPGIHSSRAFHPPARFLQALLDRNYWDERSHWKRSGRVLDVSLPLLNLCGSDVLLLGDIFRAPGIHSSRAFHPPARFLQALLDRNYWDERSHWKLIGAGSGCLSATAESLWLRCIASWRYFSSTRDSQQSGIPFARSFPAGAILRELHLNLSNYGAPFKSLHSSHILGDLVPFSMGSAMGVNMRSSCKL
ncbi:hypothetical protein BDR26DRAFT_77108 [Obelidium mucronatum]|nr:hypothetical protein BDR26DRAFT_77108 [Obelidium mucronatum]